MVSPAHAAAAPAAGSVHVPDSVHMTVKSDDPDTADVTGTITGSDGAVRSGNAVVQLMESDGTVVESAYTDDAGTYDFPSLAAGSYTLNVVDSYDCDCGENTYAPEYSGDVERFSDASYFGVAQGQELTGMDMELFPEATISGNVTGVLGTVTRDVEGIEVIATGTGPEGNAIQNASYTDGDGNYEISNALEGTYELEFLSFPGYDFYATQWYGGQTSLGVSETVTLTQYQQLTGVDQVLERGSSISGRMTDTSGRPLVGSVEVYDTDGSTADTTGSLVGGTGVNPDGTYAVKGLHPGTYKVGFTTVKTPAVGPNVIRVRPSLFQSQLDALGDLPQVYGGGPTTETGSLAPSWPYLPYWYGGSSYATATPIVISTPGQSVKGIDSSMVYDPSFMQTWPGETVGEKNLSEKLCQCFSGDPIDTATGEFFLDATDISIPGVGPQVDVARSYSSTNAAVDGPFGNGWSPSFAAHLAVLTPGTDGSDPALVQVTQENGSTVEFSLDVNGNYVAPPRVMASLDYDQYDVAATWTFTRQATDVMTFDGDGNLASTADVNGNTLDYSYVGSNLSSITASGGRTLSLTWDSGHVTAVSDSAGRTVSYGYDGDGNLISATAVDGAVTSYGYDSNHYLTTTTSPDGGVTTNTYDSSRRVTSQSDALGRVTTISYDGSPSAMTTTTTLPGGSEKVETYTNGLLTSSTAAAGTSAAATTSYAYDDADNLVKTTDPMGHSTTFSYDGNGNKLTQEDPIRHKTTWTYNDFNEVTSQTDPLGRVTTTVYDDNGNMLSTTSPTGRVQQWTYNPDGTVATSTDGRSHTTTYGYNGAGQPTSTTDPDHRTTSTTYNAAGFMTSVTKPVGEVTSYDVDAVGRVLDSTDPDHQTTGFTYDADGNQLSKTGPDGLATTSTYDLADELKTQSDAYGKKTTYAYTTAGQLASVTDPDGDKTKYTYDAAGNKTSMTDADGRRTAYHYDLDNRNTATYLPSGVHSSVAYNAASQKVATTDAKGETTTYAYDADGELISTTDPLGNVTAQSYTGDGQVSVVTLPDSSAEAYTYDADGNTTRFVNADSKATTYTYTLSNEMSGETQPGGLATTYRYNTAGMLYVTTNPDGSTFTYTYNGDGDPTRIASSAPGSTDVVYTYTESGQRKSMTDETGVSTYTYDHDGRLTTDKNGAGKTLTYAYGNEGQLLTLTYPGSKTVTYAYDPAGQMTSLTDWSSNQTTFTWTADGQLATQADPNGITETRSYDADDLPASIATAKSGTPLATYTYGHDADGDIDSQSTADPIATTTSSFGYDPNTQLTTVTVGGSSASYAATSAGELSTTAKGDALTYNSAQELTSLTPTAGPASSYSYNANGSRTASTVAATDIAPAATTNYGFDAEGNLATVTLPGVEPTEVDYTSDGDGLRQSRAVGSAITNFLWDVDGSLPLLLDDGTHSYLYGPSTSPIAQVDDSSGTIQYLHEDVIGSVRLITSGSGSVVGTTEYDSYGNRSSHTGSADSAIGYSGALTDSDTGLVYLQARDYDPATEQFLTVDPAVDTTHQPYAYVANDPLSLTDPTGLCIGLDGTPQDRPCTENDFYWAGLGGEIQASVCGSSDLYTCAVQNLDPVYAIIAGSDKCVHSADPYSCAVQTFDPFYSILDGIGKLPQDIQNGCTLAIAEDIAETVRGASGTLAAGLAGAAGVGGIAEDPEAIVTSNTYIDLTKGGSIQNIGTDATAQEFAANLLDGGWTSSLSKNGTVEIFQKGGAKYVLRDKNSSGYPGWTADYTPAGSTKKTLEIRLGYSQ
jgi:RHS repeat-associated protein